MNEFTQAELDDMTVKLTEIGMKATEYQTLSKSQEKIIALLESQLDDYRRMIDHYQKLLDRYSTPERSGEMNLTRSQEVFNLEMIEQDRQQREREKEEAYNRGFVDRSNMIPHHAIHFLQFLERNKIITINIPHSTGQFINLFFASQNEPPKIDDSLPQTPGL